MKKFFLLPFLFAFLLSSCLNEEGEGGTSVVQGKVYKVYHLNDSYSFEADTFPAAKEDVYIVYGNDDIYGDAETSATMCFCRVHMYSPFAGAANAWYAVVMEWETDRKSTRLNSSHITRSRMPSSA